METHSLSLSESQDSARTKTSRHHLFFFFFFCFFRLLFRAVINSVQSRQPRKALFVIVSFISACCNARNACLACRKIDTPRDLGV